MKLTELEATFIGSYRSEGDRTTYRELTSVDGAQGVLFICPKCGNHSVLVWFSNPRNAPLVSANVKPKPRWTFSGETIQTLSLTPSIDLSRIDTENPKDPNRCYWHGFVTNGEAN